MTQKRKVVTEEIVMFIENDTDLCEELEMANWQLENDISECHYDHRRAPQTFYRVLDEAIEKYEKMFADASVSKKTRHDAMVMFRDKFEEAQGMTSWYKNKR